MFLVKFLQIDFFLPVRIATKISVCSGYIKKTARPI